jgi:hypothetical protein
MALPGTHRDPRLKHNRRLFHQVGVFEKPGGEHLSGALEPRESGEKNA